MTLSRFGCLAKRLRNTSKRKLWVPLGMQCQQDARQFGLIKGLRMLLMQIDGSYCRQEFILDKFTHCLLSHCRVTLSELAGQTLTSALAKMVPIWTIQRVALGPLSWDSPSVFSSVLTKSTGVAPSTVRHTGAVNSIMALPEMPMV